MFLWQIVPRGTYCPEYAHIGMVNGSCMGKKRFSANNSRHTIRLRILIIMKTCGNGLGDERDYCCH